MTIPSQEDVAGLFKQYRRSQIAELRPYIGGDDMAGVSVSAEDTKAGSPKLGDMIARNPKNHADQWLVAAKYFADNFEAADALSALNRPGWRDIASAPKDGTRIWLGNGKNFVTGYWSPPVGAWRCDWVVGVAGDKPTHWMPLPVGPLASAPPAPDEEQVYTPEAVERIKRLAAGPREGPPLTADEYLRELYAPPAPDAKGEEPSGGTMYHDQGFAGLPAAPPAPSPVLSMGERERCILRRVTAELESLFAMVNGETPSLLRDHFSYGKIEAALEDANSVLDSVDRALLADLKAAKP